MYTWINKKKHNNRVTQIDAGKNNILYSQPSQEKTREVRESKLTNASTEEQRAKYRVKNPIQRVSGGELVV